ncbi:MAG: hydrogenase maturation nickel metallochaperone HypA [Nocardioides sp.]
MHELAIAESVVSTVLARTGDHRVTTVRVRVGRLAGVVPDALTFCFELATAGTSLEGALLEIATDDARGYCRDCEQEIVLPDTLLLCSCGSADVHLVSGGELTVSSVEVA